MERKDKDRKRAPKKLRVTRSTVKTLDEGKLAGVRGGGDMPTPNCTMQSAWSCYPCCE